MSMIVDLPYTLPSMKVLIKDLAIVPHLEIASFDLIKSHIVVLMLSNVVIWLQSQEHWYHMLIHLL